MIASTLTMTRDARARGYAVPAVNILDDLSLRAVIAAAVAGAVPADRPGVREDGPVDRHRPDDDDVPVGRRATPTCRSRCTSTTAPTAR